MAPSFSALLAGNQASGQIGNVTVVTDVTIQLTGVEATGQVGNQGRLAT
jgi:hypothetical protein